MERCLCHVRFWHLADIELECAPGAGQVEVSKLTGCAGLSKDESHGQTALAQHRVQAASRAGVHCRGEPAQPLPVHWFDPLRSLLTKAKYFGPIFKFRSFA